MDAESGLVHTVETTAANVHDSSMTSSLLQGEETDVYGDSGYLGSENKEDAVRVRQNGETVQYHINLRPSQMKKFTDAQYNAVRAGEHAKSSIRCKAEHVFCVVKRIFLFRKTRYRGREKLHQHSCTLFALANLHLVRNRLAID